MKNIRKKTETLLLLALWRQQQPEMENLYILTVTFQIPSQVVFTRLRFIKITFHFRMNAMTRWKWQTMQMSLTCTIFFATMSLRCLGIFSRLSLAACKEDDKFSVFWISIHTNSRDNPIKMTTEDRQNAELYFKYFLLFEDFVCLRWRLLYSNTIWLRAKPTQTFEN